MKSRTAALATWVARGLLAGPAAAQELSPRAYWPAPSGTGVAMQLNCYRGGRSTVDGVEQADLQRNSNYGVTVIWPFLKRRAVKAAFTSGLVTSTDGSYTTVMISHQVRVR